MIKKIVDEMFSTGLKGFQEGMKKKKITISEVNQRLIPRIVKISIL